MIDGVPERSKGVYNGMECSKRIIFCEMPSSCQSWALMKLFLYGGEKVTSGNSSGCYGPLKIESLEIAAQ